MDGALTPVLDEAEIARRMPVWVALADLFLDTELQPSDYRHIAAICSASAYSRDELRGILAEEVTPAFAPNLLSVAGEWAGWPEDYVRDRIVRTLAEKGLGVPAKKWMLGRLFPRKEWAQIEAMLQQG